MKYRYSKIRNIKIKVKDNLLKTLAEECSSPKELIKAVLALKGMTGAELGRIIGKTEKHIAVTLSPTGSLGPSILYEIAIGLNINPTIVFRCWADWKLKLEQEAHIDKTNNNQNNN